MKAWMTGPVELPNERWKWGFWTDAPWPFYRASVTLREPDGEDARRHFEAFVDGVREHMRKLA